MVAIKNIRNMHAVLTNQTADILHFNNIYIYICEGENLVFVKSIHTFFLKFNYFSNILATFEQPYW